MMREMPPTAGLPLRSSDFLFTETLFEAGLQEILGLQQPIITCSGTAAFVLLLAALQSRSAARTRVVVPAYSCPLVIRAITARGLEPVLCDIERDALMLSPGGLDRLVDERTLCVVPTHLAGVAEDVRGPAVAARAAGAALIEDAAQGLGVRVGGQPLGGGSDAVFFSLAAGKGLTMFEGGVLVVHDRALREAVLKLEASMLPPRPLFELRRIIELFGYAVLYNPLGLRAVYGAPVRRALSRGDEIAAVSDDFPEHIPLHQAGAMRKRVAARALRRLPEFLLESRARAAIRAPQLQALSGVRLVRGSAEAERTEPYFLLLFDEERACREALHELWGAGLGVTKPFARALSQYGYLGNALRGQPVPNAESFAARCLSVSNSPWLSDSEFARILQTIKRCVASTPSTRQAPAQT